MTRIICTTALAMLLASCGTMPQPAPLAAVGHQTGQEAAVLAAVDSYVSAISASDLQGMAAMLTPDGMTYRAVPSDDGEMEIRGRPNADWVSPTRANGPPVRERYWSPTVLIRESIAVVWAPYEFWEDGKTSHCGVDVFDLVRIKGEWRVANSMWTVEPESCAELRPADRKAIRPADRVATE